MKTLAFTLLILLLFVGIAGAAPDLSTYDRVAYFYVNTSTSATDYQVKLTLFNTTGWTTSPGIFYTNGTTRSDWTNIVFTDSSNTQISYWKENRTENATASTWWIKVPSISNSNTTQIKMYYGNASIITSYWSGVNTFPIFDDFDNGSTINTTTWAVTGAISQTNSIVTTPHSVSRLQSSSSVNTIYAMKWYGTIYNSTDASGTTGVAGFAQDTYYYYGSSILSQNPSIKSFIRDDWGATVAYLPIDQNPHSFEILHNTTTSSKTYQDGILIGTHTAGLDNNAKKITFAMSGAAAASATMTADWVFSRKYQQPNEPVISANNITILGTVPTSLFTIKLMDNSTGNPTSWMWNASNLLGNNTPVTFSTSQNPTVSLGAGNWLIILTSSNSIGSSTSNNATLGLNLSSPQVYYWNRTG